MANTEQLPGSGYCTLDKNYHPHVTDVKTESCDLLRHKSSIWKKQVLNKVSLTEKLMTMLHCSHSDTEGGSDGVVLSSGNQSAQL